MNLYFLVEGDRTETKLYRRWIGHTLPHLSEVHLVSDLTGDRFYIISGGGYPSYVDRIRDSLLDLKDQPAVDLSSSASTRRSCRTRRSSPRSPKNSPAPSATPACAMAARTSART